MNKKFKVYLILFLSVFIVSFLYKVFWIPITGDEIWNYGFSYNISKGMIIYRDFNCLQTPLYFFISSFFIKIFGNYLVSVHLFDCILISFLMIMLYKSMGFYKSILLYTVIIFNYFTTYSYFCMFLLFVIIYLFDHHEKVSYDIISFLVGLILISKQSIGLFMLIPVLFYSKSKLKSLLVYLFPFICLSIYLFIQGAFFDFINYCFLGMIDFNENNKLFTIYFVIEVFCCLYLVYKIFKSKFKDKKYLFILMFQVNAYPIFDISHFIIPFIPVMYCILRDIRFENLRLYYRGLVMVLFLAFPAIYVIKSFLCYDYVVSFDKSNYLYLRNKGDVNNVLKKESGVVKKYYGEYDYSFFMTRNSYAIKLYNNIPIGQYDLLLNGNMGYHGSERIVREIGDICKKKTCVFFVEDMSSEKDGQFSKKIYSYVLDTYSKIAGNDSFWIYDNLDMLVKDDEYE